MALGLFLEDLPEITTIAIQRTDLLRLVTRRNPVILDIGCNDGGHTNWFLDIFPGARVYSFEPDPRACRRFNRLVHNPRSQLFTVAISAVDGKTTFYQSDGLPPPELGEWAKPWVGNQEGWDLSGSIRKPKEHTEATPWCTFTNTIEVETMRLDSWLQERGDIETIDFIWADVQGAEADMISGGQEALTRTQYLYTEYSNRELYEGQSDLQELLAMLPDFEIITRYPNDVLLRNRKLT